MRTEEICIAHYIHTIQAWACCSSTLEVYSEPPKLIQAVLLHFSALVIVVMLPLVTTSLHMKLDRVINLAVGGEVFSLRVICAFPSTSMPDSILLFEIICPKVHLYI